MVGVDLATDIILLMYSVCAPNKWNFVTCGEFFFFRNLNCLSVLILSMT